MVVERRALIEGSGVEGGRGREETSSVRRVRRSSMNSGDGERERGVVYGWVSVVIWRVWLVMWDVRDVREFVSLGSSSARILQESGKHYLPGGMALEACLRPEILKLFLDSSEHIWRSVGVGREILL